MFHRVKLTVYHLLLICRQNSLPSIPKPMLSENSITKANKITFWCTTSSLF